MRLTLLGILLVFALAALPCSLVAVRAAEQVTIVNENGFLHIDGLFHVYGEVQNTGDVPVRSVSVTITLYGDGGAVLDTDGASVFPNVIPVGGKASFGYASGMAGSLVRDFAVEPNVFTATSAKPLGLEILSPTSTISGTVMRQMLVTGQIKNTGPENAGYVRVYATFFDGPDGIGSVVGFSPTTAAMALDSGASTSFSIIEDVTNRESSYVSYVLTAESDNYSMAPVIVPEFPASLVLLIFLVSMFAIMIITRKCRMCAVEDPKTF